MSAKSFFCASCQVERAIENMVRIKRNLVRCTSCRNKTSDQQYAKKREPLPEEEYERQEIPAWVLDAYRESVYD